MNRKGWIAFTLFITLIVSACSGGGNSSEKKENTTTISNSVNEKAINDELVDKVREYITSEFLTEADMRAISESEREFQLYQIDLNDDDQKEVFVNFGTTYFCGSGGCTVLLLSSDLKLITKFSPTQTLYVENNLENNWRTLLTYADGSWTRLIYSNNTYPSNPTLLEPTNDKPSSDAQKTFEEDRSKQEIYNF